MSLLRGKKKICVVHNRRQKRQSDLMDHILCGRHGASQELQCLSPIQDSSELVARLGSHDCIQTSLNVVVHHTAVHSHLEVSSACLRLRRGLAQFGGCAACCCFLRSILGIASTSNPSGHATISILVTCNLFPYQSLNKVLNAPPLIVVLCEKGWKILSHIARHTLFTSVALRSSCFVRAALQWSCFVRACCPLHYHDVALSAHAGYKDADFQFSDACLAHNCAIHVHQ
eukprot:195715-Pelagomonas_calceolata.AAC.1